MPDDEDARWGRKLGPCHFRRKATLADKQRSELITKKITQNGAKWLPRESLRQLYESARKTFPSPKTARVSKGKKIGLLINKKKEKLCWWLCNVMSKLKDPWGVLIGRGKKEKWYQKGDRDHEKKPRRSSREWKFSQPSCRCVGVKCFPNRFSWISIIDGSRCRLVAW